MPMPQTAAPASTGAARIQTAFINWAHALDHYVILIFPTVVLVLGPELGLSYGEAIGLSTACFVAFGVFALPAGWLGDYWSRRNMMAAFFLGSGLSLIAVGLSQGKVSVAVSLFALGIFAAIYHPIGTTMLLGVATRRGRALAVNGVCGNFGAALAAAMTAALAAYAGWRVAFFLPGIICLVSGAAYLWMVPDEKLTRATRSSQAERPVDRNVMGLFVGLFALAVLVGGSTFNVVSISLPKLVDERVGAAVPLVLVGGLATGIFFCGALAQLAVGRLVDRFSAHIVFVGTAVVQLVGVAIATASTGLLLLVGLAIAMAGIYGQFTVNDVVLARYTADAWRGRIYAVRFFLGFGTAGLAILALGWLHDHGGFDNVLRALMGLASVYVVNIALIGYIVSRMEARHRLTMAAAE